MTSSRMRPSTSRTRSRRRGEGATHPAHRPWTLSRLPSADPRGARGARRRRPASAGLAPPRPGGLFGRPSPRRRGAGSPVVPRGQASAPLRRRSSSRRQALARPALPTDEHDRWPGLRHDRRAVVHVAGRGDDGPDTRLDRPHDLDDAPAIGDERLHPIARANLRRRLRRRSIHVDVAALAQPGRERAGLHEAHGAQPAIDTRLDGGRGISHASRMARLDVGPAFIELGGQRGLPSRHNGAGARVRRRRVTKGAVDARRVSGPVGPPPHPGPTQRDVPA